MKKIILLSSFALMIFASCKKEVTEVKQVNQAFSAVYTIQPGNWTTANNGISYTAELPIAEVDNTIYQGGAVLVYLSFDNTNYYEALPEVFDGFTYGAIHSVGYVGIDISALSGNVINPPAQNISAKVILIDAQTLGLHKDVNFHDLGTVQKTFNIN
ncbi:MAG TPA: hypothetical protein VIJ75_02280 [Hanamia sp.]